MHNYIPRALSAELKLSSAEYPIVTVIGPRQSGKTTLVRALFGDHAYANLEDPGLRHLARDDPKAFLSRYPAPVIYDREFLSGIRYFQKLSASTDPGWVIYAGDLEFEGGGYRVINFANAFTTMPSSKCLNSN